jgi:predicted 2-oxoglutarate/Fe(II)-dependent dioxygenase YbiX
MSYLISKYIEQDDLSKLHQMMRVASWQDGLSSYSSDPTQPDFDPYKIKKNMQCDIDTDIIYNALDKNEDFLSFTFARKTGKPLFTNTYTGGYYNAHFDHPNCGHFSTTIFLSDPDTYDGGELVLLLDGEEKKFKLDAGYGITYETGIAHRVNKVTRGDRYAAVLWSTSFIFDMDDLHKWRYYTMMTNRFGNELYYEDLISFKESLYTHFRSKCDKIARKYVNASPQ